jgi:hypothetical protein
MLDLFPTGKWTRELLSLIYQVVIGFVPYNAKACKVLSNIGIGPAIE